MDFIRAAAKAIFYDFPETEVRHMLLNPYTFARFQQTVCELLSQGNREYSRTDAKRIWEYVRDKWIFTENRSLASKLDIDVSPLFNILSSLGSECLDLSSTYPRVRFENLLRWRSISYLISEDIITIPTLVLNDLERVYPAKKRRFGWPDVLEHNNVIINKVIQNGLADTHAHLFASSDIFMLNWISMMNNPKILKQMAQDVREKGFMGEDRFPMERELITITYKETNPFYHLALLATLCRAFLFAELKGLNISDSIYQSIIDGVEDISTLNSQVFDRINVLRMFGVKSVFRSVADYALSGMEDDNHNSPYFILAGERKLLYDVFQLVFSRTDGLENISKILFLYLSLKTRIRREMVQTNSLRGFDNFQLYQNRKSLFLNNDMWSSINVSYAIYSSLGRDSLNNLEGRVTPNSLSGLLRLSVCNPFSSWNERETLRTSSISKSVSNRFSLVVHFIKKPLSLNKASRWDALRKFRVSLWKDINLIMKARAIEKRIVGIDVAGSELNCRPEIFAPMFRWAKYQGLGNNMTFHAGEDYYDIVDGLRTIYEAVMLMDFDSGCRIGHAIAIGKDPHRFYKERHYAVIAPAQIILDNLIWIRYFAIDHGIHLSEETQAFIDKVTYDLYFFIGYSVDNPLDYWHSMLMRGNDREIPETYIKNVFTTRSKTAKPIFWGERKLIQTSKAVNLNNAYEMDPKIYRNGLQPYEIKVSSRFHEDVAKLQTGMMKLLKQRGIAIEANPSSNLKIGGLDTYDELPLFRLFPIEQPNEDRMLVSINTDDRGVFATNLSNEYSLVAASLMKHKDPSTGKPIYSITQIANYIRCLAENGKATKFQIHS